MDKEILSAKEYFNSKYPLGTFPTTRNDVIKLMEDWADYQDSIKNFMY